MDKRYGTKLLPMFKIINYGAKLNIKKIIVILPYKNYLSNTKKYIFESHRKLMNRIPQTNYSEHLNMVETYKIIFYKKTIKGVNFFYLVVLTKKSQ